VNETTDAVIIPAGGLQQHALSWRGGNYQPEGQANGNYTPGILASGSTLYIGLTTVVSVGELSFQIAAIDMATARVRWERTISVPGEASPVNLIGADSAGVLDAMENSSASGQPDASTSSEYPGGMTLARLSAPDAKITYGSGASYTAGPSIDEQPVFVLAGHLLLSFPSCGGGSCSTTTNAVAAYRIGSWPG
jgi:hypothetical protein